MAWKQFDFETNDLVEKQIYENDEIDKRVNDRDNIIDTIGLAEHNGEHFEQMIENKQFFWHVALIIRKFTSVPSNDVLFHVVPT